MTKHPLPSTSPELPPRASSRVRAGFSVGGSSSRPRRLLHSIEFFAGGEAEELLDERSERLVERSASGSLAAHEERPRDPRLRAAIDAAARGFISDRARVSG